MKISKSISIFISLLLAKSSTVFGKPLIKEKLNFPSINNYNNYPLIKKSNTNNLQSINDISYKESLSEINNPYRGIFKQLRITLKRNGNSQTQHIQPTSLLRILVDMSDYKNDTLDSDATTFLKNQFELYKQNHKSIVLRFAYDPKYEGKETKEPKPVDKVLFHQNQLKDIIKHYEDIIAVVECGLYGKYGEMHGSSVYSENEKYNFVNQVIDKWLSILPESITMNVRTPTFYCEWGKCDINAINKNITTPNQPAYRVGIYNDGYLGTYNDYSTYKDRDKEIEWLSNQGKHTLFGGEFGKYNDSKMGNVKHTAKYMIEESFKTHTSYLNKDWYNETVYEMKHENYSGPEQLYLNKTGFEYIENHLGYRFVARGVRITKSAKRNGLFRIEVDIENVGFGNLIKPKSLVFIMEGSNKTYRLSDLKNVENENPSQWESRTTTTFKCDILLPKDMSDDDYKIYLRIASGIDSEGLDGYPIQFANDDKSLWNEKLGGNYLGSFTVNGVEKKVFELSGMVKDSNNNRYSLGVPKLREYKTITINKLNDERSAKYRTWFVDSEDKPSLLYLSTSLPCSNEGEPSDYCLDLSEKTNSQGYNYLSVVKCTEAKHKFMYGGSFENSIDVYSLNEIHITTDSNENLCLLYSKNPQLAKCDINEPKLKWIKHTQ